MEIELCKEQIQNYKRTCSQLICREETVEAVVPDVMPDVQQIMDTDAQVYLRGKEIEDGRLTVSAFLEGTVLYLPEGETGLRRLNLSGNLSFSLDDPGILRGSAARLCLRCTAAEAKMLNPRKVLLRAEICTEVSVYRPELTEYTVGAEAEGLQTLCRKETVRYIAAVEEKTFVIAEDFVLPGGEGFRELLRARVRIECGETRSVAGKLIVQGTAWLDVLYCAADGALPETATFSANFSQIIDVRGEYSSECSVVLMPTALYVEPAGSGEAALSMELHMVAQAVCADEREIVYLADAYSIREACRTETEQLRFGSGGKVTLCRETLREMLECGEAVAEVMEIYVTGGRAVTGEGKLRMPVCVHLLCRGERGGLVSLNRRLTMDGTLPAELANAQPGVVRCGEPYASAVSGAVELRLALETEMCCSDGQELSVVSALVPDPEAPEPHSDRPSVTVVRRDGTELWELAKKYGSTLTLIEAANPETADIPAFLLIPRCR